MEKSGKIILAILGLTIITVIGIKYYQFYIHKDFTLITLAACDPAVESCFRVVCDGECEESSIIFSDGSPYKYVSMPASLAPLCLEDMTCLDFTCDTVGEECETTFCSDEILEEGEECVPTDAIINTESIIE